MTSVLGLHFPDPACRARMAIISILGLDPVQSNALESPKEHASQYCLDTTS